MNVLIIPAFFRTKARPTMGSFFMDQAVALRRAGHQVTILYCDSYSVKCVGEWLRYAEESVQTAEGIPIYRARVFCPLKHGMEGHREAFTETIIRLYENYVEKEQKVDVIHAHCCVWAGYAAMRLSEKKRIPYVITEHATMFGLHRDKISGKNNQYIAEAFKKADSVICVSNAFRRLLSEYRPETEMKVIGNVVDCERFVPAADSGHGGSFLSICYMETEDQLRKKGMDILLKAWRQIARKYPEARLLIGGGGRAQRKVLEWVREYRIQESVELLGSLSRAEVVAQMQQCDCFVLPSRYETFGVVYIEAMACGKPVIAAANGGPDDFVTDSNGLLIAPEDVDALRDAMERMLQDREQYVAADIRAYVESGFSAPAIARQLEDVYKEVKRG
ncbi:MAG: glycosyltransferase family 4 protein [Roseburia sp.]|nr:glycosyltransferase family 4 protein [Roseburia sp.]